MRKVTFVALALMLTVTGCGFGQANNATASNNPVNNALAQNQTNTANNTANTTGNTIANNTGNSTGNSTGPTGPMPSQQTMANVSNNLIKRYILSHNDATLAAYRKDVKGFFGAGLAQFVSQVASPGVDYKHPISKYSYSISGTQPMTSTSFETVATLNLKFKNGKSEVHHYQFFIAKDNNQWLISRVTGS